MTKMDDEILYRFNLILGHESSTVDLDKLSSAQRARFISWLRENNLALPQVNEKNQSSSVEVAQVTNDVVALGTNTLGIDIQFVSELLPMETIDLKSDPEILRIFTRHEIAYAETKPYPKRTLAGIFAAKEAIIKAGFSGIIGKDLTNLEISHEDDGKPYFSGYSLSISHSNEYAISIASQNKISTEEHNLNTRLTQNNGDARSGVTTEALGVQTQGFTKLTTLLIVIFLSAVMGNIEYIKLGLSYLFF